MENYFQNFDMFLTRLIHVTGTLVQHFGSIRGDKHVSIFHEFHIKVDQSFEPMSTLSVTYPPPSKRVPSIFCLCLFVVG